MANNPGTSYASKNKKRSSKGESGFTAERKKKTINSYKKLLRKDKRDDALHSVIKRQKQKKAGFKVDSYAKVKKLADEKREQIEAEKLRQQQEREKRAKEKEEAKVAAAEKRKKRQKLFSKKTYKGQPYLHNQMSFLLEKIEANIANEARSSTS